jgi:DNA repair protein RadC
MEHLESIKEVIPLVRERATSLPEGLSLVRDLPINCSSQVAEAFRQLKQWEREVFAVLLLNSKNRIEAFSVISIGSINASLVHPREVFRPAVLLGAVGLICVHNHPSGNPAPSPEDRQITKRLADAGRMMGIRILDHIIVGESDYYSFADHGEL